MIIDVKKPKEVCFSELRLGEVFIGAGHTEHDPYYMRIEDLEDGGNAVALINGSIVEFSRDDLVIVVRGRFLVEGRV